MKLQKIVERLQKLHPKEIDLSLDRTRNLLEKLGNPQDQINCISVVGTNGKFSTIQALYAILKEANYKCNIYTSPHIQKINERFVFNNKPLTDEELANQNYFRFLKNFKIKGIVKIITSTDLINEKSPSPPNLIFCLGLKHLRHLDDSQCERTFR